MEGGVDSPLRAEPTTGTVGSAATAMDAPVFVPPAGNLVFFGLSNRFDVTYPIRLVGKAGRCDRELFATRLQKVKGKKAVQVAPEEFEATLKRVHAALEKSLPRCLRWFFAGYLLAVCTLGVSLAPGLYLRRRTIKAVKTVLAAENDRVYHSLQVHWDLVLDEGREPPEYVIVIDCHYRLPSASTPTVNLMMPD